MPFLPPNQQRQSTEGMSIDRLLLNFNRLITSSQLKNINTSSLHLDKQFTARKISITDITGGAEIASTGKCKYGKVKYKVAKCVWVENTSTENSSTAT